MWTLYTALTYAPRVAHDIILSRILTNVRMPWGFVARDGITVGSPRGTESKIVQFLPPAYALLLPFDVSE